MQKKWLYFIVIIGSIGGSIWLLWNRANYAPTEPDSGLNVCLFRRFTGLPCPSCGTTRAVLDISRLEFRAAFYTNPIGFLLVFAMVVFPCWVLYDLASRKNTFYRFYNSAELVIKRRWVAIPLILMVLVNWLWNIYKFTS